MENLTDIPGSSMPSLPLAHTRVNHIHVPRVGRAGGDGQCRPPVAPGPGAGLRRRGGEVTSTAEARARRLLVTSGAGGCAFLLSISLTCFGHSTAFPSCVSQVHPQPCLLVYLMARLHPSHTDRFRFFTRSSLPLGLRHAASSNTCLQPG